MDIPSFLKETIKDNDRWIITIFSSHLKTDKSSVTTVSYSNYFCLLVAETQNSLPPQRVYCLTHADSTSWECYRPQNLAHWHHDWSAMQVMESIQQSSYIVLGKSLNILSLFFGGFIVLHLTNCFHLLMYVNPECDSEKSSELHWDPKHPV